jgi:hypothetical protein
VLHDRLAGLGRITGLVHTRPIMHLPGPYGHQYLVDARQERENHWATLDDFLSRWPRESTYLGLFFSPAASNARERIHILADWAAELRPWACAIIQDDIHDEHWHLILWECAPLNLAQQGLRAFQQQLVNGVRRTLRDARNPRSRGELRSVWYHQASYGFGLQRENFVAHCMDWMLCLGALAGTARFMGPEDLRVETCVQVRIED